MHKTSCFPENVGSLDEKSFLVWLCPGEYLHPFKDNENMQSLHFPTVNSLFPGDIHARVSPLKKSKFLMVWKGLAHVVCLGAGSLQGSICQAVRHACDRY